MSELDQLVRRGQGARRTTCVDVTPERADTEGGRLATSGKITPMASPESSSARFLLEVVAGLVPTATDATLTKQWAMTSDDWYGAADEGARGELFETFYLQAVTYVAELVPARANWARIEIVYL